jgi:hypothetical protein
MKALRLNDEAFKIAAFSFLGSENNSVSDTPKDR